MYHICYNKLNPGIPGHYYGQAQDAGKGKQMASIEFITKRIEGKRKEITKLEGKLSRIQKAQASGWESNNPYYYNESDLKWTLKDLETARIALADYEKQLATETEKANSRNVPAILEFLEYWKANCTALYRKGLEEYYETRKVLRDLYAAYSMTHYGTPEREAAEAAYNEAKDKFDGRLYGYFHEEKYEWRGHIHSKKVKDMDGEIEYIRPYNNERTLDEAMAKLAKDLKREAEMKYDDIIERTNSVVGQITDASELRIGSTRGELNGFIKGERGKAEVESIMAGGYNIQCLHIRTLIKPVK